MQRITWGIIGPGNIAARFAEQLAASATGTLSAVASRSLDRAQSFADRFSTGQAPVRAFGSYTELFADPGIDAVYIAVPHTEHVRLVVEAAEAGKHIVCEKPLSVDKAGALTAIDAAQRGGVYLAEAYMYRFHPQTERLVDLVRTGAIGQVQHIEASFAFAADAPPEHRLMNPDLAGGGILDVGGYTVSMARLIAGAANGEPFAEPTHITAAGTIGPTGVDEWATASLTFASGITAHLTAGIRVQDDNRVVVSGSAGRIVLAQPWLPNPDADTTIEVHRTDSATKHIAIPAAKQYALQADAVAAFHGTGQAPQMNWADSLGTAEAMDRWRAAIGLRYPFEQTTTAAAANQA